MTSTRKILVDAHVHLHDCFDRGRFFTGAAGNLAAAARFLDLGDDWEGCLMLTESRGTDAFGELSRRARGGEASGDWSFHSTGEEESLIALGPEDRRVFLIAGRQLVTSERLEVLALARRLEPEDGMELVEAIDAVVEAGAFPVIPWGFGKWWGRRGALVRELLGSERGERIALGDNSGRPALSPRPRLFAAARDRDVPVLPGSDPLPFRNQERLAGRYGFVDEIEWDEERPAAALRGRLAERRQPDVFGWREGPLGFVEAQARMQLRKLTGRR